MGNIQNKKRIAWVDVAKAIAIIFVLIIHYDRRAAGRIAALGLMFCVQLFFFLSGMFANCEKYSLKEYIKRQAKALMLPYAVFSVINIVFHYLFNRGLPPEVFKEIVINIILARRNYMLVAAMWFLPCLFLVSTLYKLLTMAIKNKKILFLLCFAASAYAKVFMQEPILPFTANQAIRFLVYFAAGSMIYPFAKDLSIEKFREQNIKVKSAIIVYTVVAAVLIYILYKKEYIIYFENDFLFYSSLFINTVMIISFVVIISVLLAWCVPLVKIGQNTLGFCCLENINRAVVNTAMAVTGIGFIPDTPLKVVVFNFIAMAAGYVIIMVINRFCPLLFGKNGAKK
ncbi:MAG: acyltransferase [Ruminococcaceae bacterium]|nr:acyltransferase [Oscillospiraceae bacterium]